MGKRIEAGRGKAQEKGEEALTDSGKRRVSTQV